MELLQFDFQKAARQAAELEALAEKMKSLACSRYEDTIQTLSGAWQGTSADTYMKKAKILQDKMERNADDLRRTAEALRTVAQIVRNAEIRAEELARQRMDRT